MYNYLKKLNLNMRVNDESVCPEYRICTLSVRLFSDKNFVLKLCLAPEKQLLRFN